MTIKVGTIKRVNVAWALAVVGGISLFVLAKWDINRNRYKAMKIRERMNQSNIGDYESSRKF